MINRQNYEVWFIDFLDGKLTDDQLAQLHAFLAQHADLAAELDEMSADLPVIMPEMVKAPVAKKQIETVGGLNEHSFETAFIAYHENDLSEAEKHEVDVFLAKNPFLQREFALFGQSVVTHSGEVFPQKRQLKHTVPLAPLYRYAAVAASVLLLISVGTVWISSGDETEGAGLAYRPVQISAPHLVVTGTPVAVPTQEETLPGQTFPGQTLPDNGSKRVQWENMAQNGEQPVQLLKGSSEPSLAVAPVLSLPTLPNEAVRSTSDEMTLVQAFGKAIETGVGENSVSDGLRDDRKITAGDMADLAAAPFKKSQTPVLATEKGIGGKRRIKLRLGIFEADFALK